MPSTDRKFDGRHTFISMSYARHVHMIDMYSIYCLVGQYD